MTKDEINKKEILAKISPIIDKVGDNLNLVVLETDFIRESGIWYLRIYIYSEDHPISHTDCENFTRELGDWLDTLIPVPYYLEVSSPGIDRKLKSVREYNIFRGKKIEIKLKRPLEDTRKLQARIIKYTSEDGLEVENISTGKTIYIKDDNISSARLIQE